MRLGLRPGQRYMSETEPELGLGIIAEVADKQVKVFFGASETERVYGVKTAPLKRVRFESGDTVKSREGSALEVEEVSEDDGYFIYHGAGQNLHERDLDDHLAFNRPEEKLFNGQIDTEKFFQLRLRTLEYQKNWETSPVKGLLGGRISLIPHQFYIASQVLKRHAPRILLADEVGLGKTIEAGLIIHQLVISARAQRVLVVVPDSLVYQWFFEMHRKFQLGFAAINQETPPEPGENPFLANERVIVSLGLIKGSKLAQDMLSQADFDVVVIDEAHQYKKEEGSFEYSLLEDLTSRIASVLLLTATPEQLGMEGHFDRLRLLDPDRYNDFESFKEEVAGYEKVALAVKNLLQDNLSETNLFDLKGWLSQSSFDDVYKGNLSTEDKTKIIRELIDRHGTGRVFFRNTRQAMRKEYDFFPKRILHPLAIKCSQTTGDVLGFEEKAMWLLNFLKGTENKVLLICHSKALIMALEKFIKEHDSQIKTALFHSGLSLMARDRQAAYFSDEQGAQILLCTEIGSEGRNFEFAQNLVLFDLPKKPDLLEQRIGRLDRIGQKADIHIHVPYVEKSWEELLFNIYDRGLDSFRRFSSVGTPVFVHFSEEIHRILEGAADLSDELIKRVEDYRLALEKQLEESRDQLIEMNSFDPEVGHQIIRMIRESESQNLLKNFMEDCFDCFGVDVEEINEVATYIKPNDNMFIPYFPHLQAEGQTITFDRREALDREDYQFLTWDHPMVREISNLILSESYGNMTVAMRKGGGGKKSFVEVYFVTDCPAPDFLDTKRFFPPTLIRTLVDKEGEDFADKWDKETLDSKLVQAEKSTLEKAIKVPKNLIKDLIKRSEVCAWEQAETLLEQQRLKMLDHMEEEIDRLEALSKINPAISPDEVDLMRALKKAMLDSSKQARLRLEGIRLIL
ncbi:MAG: DEAD/DEAH box helicase family protein [Bacteriovoracaceae bacterium]|nr:DEAD/DEAH box helicase family protein [Bacteriovoracaceae bacterium]